jgi:hypothetical protein
MIDNTHFYNSMGKVLIIDDEKPEKPFLPLWVYGFMIFAASVAALIWMASNN